MSEKNEAIMLYCTSRNSGPSWNSADHVTMLYLGSSFTEAEEAVGKFTKYEKDKEALPYEFRKGYSALPRNINWELTRYYMADGWWYTIVMFEVGAFSP